MNTLKPSSPEAEPRNRVEESAALIDTSKMSSGQRAALELTEAARDKASKEGSFAEQLFMGRVDVSSLFPFPAQSAEDRDQGDAFLHRLERFLCEKVDPDEIDRTGEIPQPIIDEHRCAQHPPPLDVLIDDAERHEPRLPGP